MKVTRLAQNPIIRPDMSERIGTNINGPSLIRVPEWVIKPLGRYYLYFAHHQGTYIRLAYADALEGPWSIYEPGTLPLEGSYFIKHIASPDVHVDNARQEFLMYLHGPNSTLPKGQVTRLAVSKDGIRFRTNPEVLGAPYWRVFHWCGHYYAVDRWGKLSRSSDARSGFTPGPTIFLGDEATVRHTAVDLQGDTLYIYYSKAGDAPEHILCAKLTLRGPWTEWHLSKPISVLVPEMPYEGVNLPLEPSATGAIHQPARQLRDPAVYREGKRLYLLYSVAGEHGIALAEVCGVEDALRDR